jgi:hypothetical protein
MANVVKHAAVTLRTALTAARTHAMAALTVVSVISLVKSGAATRSVLKSVLSHALHVLSRVVLRPALTASAVCHAELLATGFLAPSAARRLFRVIINALLFAELHALMSSSVKSVGMRRSRAA